MLLFAITSMAQNKITISGVVTDKTGETVIGASVRVKGQESKGSITDIMVNIRLLMWHLILP